jgi:site-specific recombinase XerD
MKPENSAKLLKFPVPSEPKTPKKIRNVDGIKYFNSTQIKLIRRNARENGDLDAIRGSVTGVREWAAIDLLTSTGLRVSEAANLRCGDIKAGYGESKIFVRKGKGDISGHVVIPESLKKHLKQFLRWKESHGEPIGEDDHLFVGQRGPWTSQAIQQIVKKYLKGLNLYEKRKSAHALRHSYAVELYSKEKDIRAVQKQLRHVSLQSTLVYADVTEEAIGSQIKGLWN